MSNIQVDVKEALNNKESYEVIYTSPWPGLNKDGVDIDVGIELRLSVDGAIDIARYMHHQRYYTSETEFEYVIPDDDVLLTEFIAVNWAEIVTKGTNLYLN
tara:strand:- start:5715 stop:6017 length:303 start_codon:yes stop_codon:yes gene_type:complete